MQFLPLLLLAIASTASASFSKRSYSEQLPSSDDNSYPPGGEKPFHGAKPAPYTGGEAPTEDEDEYNGDEASHDQKPCDRRHGPCRHRKPEQPVYGAPAATATSTTSCTTGNVLPTSQAKYTTPSGELPASAVRPTCTTETVTKTHEKIVPTTIVNTQTKVVEKPVTQYQTATRTVEHVATVTQPVYKTETATVTTTICETKTATRTVEHTVVSTAIRKETVTNTRTVEHTKVETATVTKTVQQKEYVTQTDTQTQTAQATPTPAGELPFNQQKKPASSYGYTPAPAPVAAAPAHEQKQPYGGGYPSAGAKPSSNDYGY